MQTNCIYIIVAIRVGASKAKRLRTKRGSSVKFPLNDMPFCDADAARAMYPIVSPLNGWAQLVDSGIELGMQRGTYKYHQ